MGRKNYMKQKREALLNNLMYAEGDEKKKILMRIINLDLETFGKDTFSDKKRPGKYTLKRNKFIYIS